LIGLTARNEPPYTGNGDVIYFLGPGIRRTISRQITALKKKPRRTVRLGQLFKSEYTSNG